MYRDLFQHIYRHSYSSGYTHYSCLEMNRFLMKWLHCTCSVASFGAIFGKLIFHKMEISDFRLWSWNLILLLPICMKREIHEWQFSPFFVILSEKLVNFNMISREIDKIIQIKWEFTGQNWSETWFLEMLKIALKHEFPVNLMIHH